MKIIAHRGNDNIHRENSIEAILNSLNKSYVDGVEFDIRLTKDNIFVINHDPIYRGYIISNTKIDTLKKLKIPTLEELLQKIKNKKILMIEVKTDKEKLYKISKILNNMLKKYNLNYYICSFNYKFINYFKKKYNFKCGLIIGPIINKKYILNNLNFNSINYKYRGKIPNKQTFYWTVNKTENIKGDNIITDFPKEIYDYLKKV